jgi:hypothetical protein
MAAVQCTSRFASLPAALGTRQTGVITMLRDKKKTKGRDKAGFKTGRWLFPWIIRQHICPSAEIF